MTQDLNLKERSDEEIEAGSDVEMDAQGDVATPEQAAEGYWCVVCQRFLKAEEHEGGNLIVHDDVPHPSDMNFAEQGNPQ